MEENRLTIRVMTMEDYDEVYRLWMGIHGFGIRSVDDSREGVERRLSDRFSAAMTAEGAVCIMCA